MREKLRIGILASTKATDLQALIEAINAGRLNAEISILLSNKQDAFALERARNNGIKAEFVDPKLYASKEEYDAELMKRLEAEKAGLVLLIGYNKFLTEGIVEKLNGRMMNIHPSLLPSFKGWDKNVHEEVLDYGCKVSGCSLFFVTMQADAGPLIMQKAVEISENESVDSLKEKVQKAEGEVLVEAAMLFAEGRLKVEGSRVRIEGRK